MSVNFWNQKIARRILDCYSNIEKSESDEISKGLEDSDKFHKVMKEFGEGKLKSSSGDVVTDKDQALAIAYSEAKGVKKSDNFDLKKIASEHDENETEGYQELEDEKIVTDFDKDNK